MLDSSSPSSQFKSVLETKIYFLVSKSELSPNSSSIKHSAFKDWAIDDAASDLTIVCFKALALSTWVYN
jgi:hypothetical protein